MRCAAGRSIALHGIDGVDDGELWSHGLCQLQKHIGEILYLGPTVVHLGLFQSRNSAEEILDTAGITGHGMGL